ncbi:MAG: hypothetical protein WDZ59_13870 [Pirellulales bacterium]
MKHTICHMLLALAAAVPANAADEADPVQQLESKIVTSLETGDWHDASEQFVLAIWSDFKTAHLKERPQPARPNGRYEDFVGKFARTESAGMRVYLTVSRSESGRFFIELEGHVIPAVTTDGNIYFTTGDVVHSRLPMLADKRYAALEMFLITQVDGEFAFTSPGSSSTFRRKLVKLAE